MVSGIMCTAVTASPAVLRFIILHKYFRLPKLKEWIDKNDPGAPLVPFSGVLESKLFEMDAEEKKAFLKEHNITRYTLKYFQSHFYFSI